MRTAHLSRAAVLLVFFFAGASSAYAGTIDPVNKYAWGTVASWVNFAPTNAGLTVTDSTITGYAWGANTGWINFSPANGGVTNTTAGTLGGYAWDEGGGWVSFTGVTIDTNGRFHGTATGGTVKGVSYVINFDCTNCNVSTDWRPTAGASPTPSVPAASASPGSIAPFFFNTLSLPQIQETNAAPSANVGGGNAYSFANNFLSKKSPSKAPTAATTTSFTAKVISIVRAAAVPVSIVSLLVLVFFLLF